MIDSGISTASLYPLYTEKALKELAVRGVDVSEVFFNSSSELEVPFVKELKNIKDSYNIKIPSIHPFSCCAEPFMFFTQYERRFLDILDYYKKYFEAADILGAKYFVFHGNNIHNEFPEKLYFERYAKLVETGKSFGIDVLHENVVRCTGGDLEFDKRMVSYLGDTAQFVLDVKQAVRKGIDPFEFLSNLSTSIRHIHLSDHGSKGDCLLVGDGDFDFDLFVKKLVGIKYSGSIILEVYTNCYNNYNQLSENLKYIRNIIANNV